MTAAVQPDLFEAGDCFEVCQGHPEPAAPRPPRDTRANLHAVATDYRRDREREALRVAVTACAAAHGGRVHIRDLRPLIPAFVPPNLIGAVLNGWTGPDGPLIDTGEWAPMGGTAGNAAKPARVRRLVRPIPA